MKKIFFTVAIMFALNSQAQIMSFCNKKVEAEARAAFSVDFPSDVIIAIESKATHYVGFHTKMYTADIASAQGVTSYEIQVFEFETATTECVIDSVKLNIETAL